MGKSNKFDFSNRPNSGAKLGKSIAQSLQREAAKVQKGGNGHPLDLQAPAKELSDEGGLALLESLETALQHGGNASGLTLFNLNLSGNKLSARIFGSLARVIDNARSIIQFISLANNLIEIASEQDILDFGNFLCATKRCPEFAVLDLSGNDLGPRAFECFARFYGDGRCVRYLNLQRTSITDADALWLSFVVEHYQHASSAESPENSANLDDNDGQNAQIHDLLGIDYTDNQSTVGKDGLQVLQRAEKVNRTSVGNALDADEDIESSTNVDSEDSPPTKSRITSKSGKRAGSNTRNFRDFGDTELESIRRKIQRHLLEYKDHSDVLLWGASLQACSAARTLRYLLPPRLARVCDVSRTEAPVSSPIEMSELADVSKLYVNVTTPAKPGSKPALSYSDAVGGRKPKQDSFVRQDRQDISKTVVPTKDIKSTELSVSKTSCPGRSDKPVHHEQISSVASRIVSSMLPERQRGLLSVAQIDAAVAWGLNRDTLSIARQWNKHADSLQIWQLLDAISGLAYDDHSE